MPAVMTVVPKMSGLVPPSASSPTYDSMSGGSRAQLAKAELAMYEAPVAPATTLGGFLGQLTFQFNPKELSITKSASWTPHTARAGEQAAGPAEFNGSQPSKL